MLTRAALIVVAALTTYSTAQTQPEARRLSDSKRDSILHIVTQIQRADYEGDRAALKRLHDALTPVPADSKLASRVLYWQGFAMWRRAINGFNETPTPKDLEADLTQAVADFKDSIARDPNFVESKIGAGSSLGYLIYLNPNRFQELMQQSSPLLKEAMAAEPDNPRLLWVLGPIRWSSPPERGGGQDKAFDLYNRGLEAIRKQKPPSDPARAVLGRARAVDESRVVESEPDHARLESRRGRCASRFEDRSLLALRSRHSGASDSGCASKAGQASRTRLDLHQSSTITGV